MTNNWPVLPHAFRFTRRGKAIPLTEQGKHVLGIMKIGANITFSGSMHRTAANFDIMSVARALAPNFHLHFITKITRNTIIPKESSITDISLAKEDINDLGLSGILVFNGSFNAYGGVEPKETIAVWKCINNFKGRVFYVHTDGQMRFHQIWNENWHDKGWASNWKKDDIVVTRKDIVYLTQARSASRILQLTRSRNIVDVTQENIVHFPIDQAILLRPPVLKKERRIKHDLIYGGSFRSGKRRDRMIKWYFGHKEPKLDVLMFGNLSIKNFGNPGIFPYPDFEGPTTNADFVRKLSTSRATCIIVDDWYRNHWMTLRFYESLIAGTVPFIDFVADTKHKLYFGGSPLEDFLYVKKRKELGERIELIKNEDCLDEVVDLCRDSVRSHWDAQEYKEALKTLIIERL
jgi:hypothetical protein